MWSQLANTEMGCKAWKMYLLFALVFFINQISCDVSDCVSTSPSSDCQTLDQYSKQTINSSTVLQFIEQNYNLTTTFSVSDVNNIALVGRYHTASIVCRAENAGFIFRNVSGLEIRNLKLIGCGANFHYRAALVILQGRNLTMTDITIDCAKDAGIYGHDVTGTISIANLKIANTTATLQQRRGNQFTFFTKNYNFILQDSEITDNAAGKENQSNVIAGLTIEVIKCSGNITIQRSVFKNNSGTKHGGNLIIFVDQVPDISAQNIYVSDCEINGGRAISGAGIYIFITKENNPTPSEQPPCNTSNGSITLANVTFRNNIAEYLGAAFYIQLKASTQKYVAPHCHYNISIENSIFINNALTKNKKGGIAFHSNYFDIDDYLLQVRPQYKVMLRNVSFSNHTIVDGKTIQETSGNSVIFINTNDYFVINNVTITHNIANAITAVKSNLVLKGYIALSHNNGSSGGGLLLCQNAILYFQPNTTLEIYNNSASHAGGGIYVEPQCLQEQPPCFFQVSNEIKENYKYLNHTVSVKIHNNTASFGGHNLFGGDVDYCYMIDSPDKNKSPFTNLQAYYDIFEISDTDSSVTSLPRHICFCKEQVKNCSIQKLEQELLYPGEVFNIEAVLVGQMNGTVPGVIQTWVNQTNGATLNLNGKVQNISYECTPLKYTIGIQQSQTSSFTAQLAIGVQHSGDQSGYERLPSFHKKYFEVILEECPFGFTLGSNGGGSNNFTCSECITHLEKDFECHIKPSKEIVIKRKANANAWIGFEYSENGSLPSVITYNKNCPFDYCITNKINMNMHKQNYNNSTICANNRHMMMCGACKENYSAILGSSKCSKCESHNLFLIAVFALGGILLVAALTLLNLTIAEGTLSGLIFFANVIESNSSFIIPHKDHNILPTPILRVFLAWINLDFGIPACFYNGMDAYAKAWLEFVFPLYIWGIAIAIILLSNRFQLVAKIAGKNAVKVLATIVLLSYTTFTHTVIGTFAYTTIHKLHKNSNQTTTITAWLVDPNITYFEPKHLLLFGVALILGLFTLPFTFTLLFIKHLLRFSHKKPIKWIQSLKPFLDAYTGPYSDSGRFWPGLLLLARICLSLAGGLNALREKKVIQNVTSLVIIILLGTAAMVSPGLYRSRILDGLEYFFLLNLSILFLGTTYYYNERVNQKIIFDVTVGMAFLAFTMIVLYHLLLKTRRYSIIRQVCGWARAKTRVTSDTTTTVPQNMNYLPPFVSFTEEREPLLADHDE